MATWSEFEQEAPKLATAIRSRFDAHLHHIVATLRRDGAPRLSGTEIQFHGDDAWMGMMPGSTKSRDLRRDPRFALHCAPVDTELKEGDAKISGRAIEVTDDATVADFAASLGDSGPQPFDGHLFRLDLQDASLVRVSGDQLHLDVWHAGGGVTHVSRS
jgi:hypothetical protein